MGHINESDLANKFQLKINSNLYKTYLIKDLLFKLITVVFNLSFPFLCSFSDIFLFFSLKQTKKIMPPAYDLTSTLKYWQDIQQCRVPLDWFKISTDCVPVSSNLSFIWKLVKQNWWKFRGLHSVNVVIRLNAFTKGQLISKCPFGVIVWTKIPTKKFDKFCPRIWKVVKSTKY